MSVRSHIESLRHQDDGTAVLELGLAIPLVFVLLLGMIDIARGYSMKLQLEQSAQRSIEKVMNGQADKDSAAALKTEAAFAAGVPETSSNPTVDFWLECNGVRQVSYDNITCPSGQVFRRYLTVKINKTFNPVFDFRWAGTNADGSYTIQGATSVRTQ